MGKKIWKCATVKFQQTPKDQLLLENILLKNNLLKKKAQNCKNI